MKNKCNGFTLAELLIVVAIIGVLVAVTIPVFSRQLEKSREATDLAKIYRNFTRVSPFFALFRLVSRPALPI